MYLVDTNIISAGAPTIHPASEAVATWMDQNSEYLFLSVITVAEIEDGIAKSRREGATRKASALANWFEVVLHLYRDRILSFDLPAARIAGGLFDLARANGNAPGFADTAIAAIARVHKLTLLTRNLRHFSTAGLQVLNPFDALPASNV